MKKDFLTVEDIVEELKVSRSTIRSLFRRKVIPNKMIGKKYFTTREELKKYIEGDGKTDEN
jgi:excisionase family DNA binding protein